MPLPLIASGAVALTPNNSSVNVQLPDPAAGTRMRINNPGATIAFYKLGKDNSVAADATAIPIPPGATLEAARQHGTGNTWIAVFSTAAGTIAISVTCGSTGGT